MHPPNVQRGEGTGVFHGDTYPLLNYAWYVPAAAVSPVRDGWDSTDGALWIAIALIGWSAVKVRTDAALARDPGRVAGLLAACLMAVQISADYWSPSYLPWAYPLVVLALL